MSAWQSIRILRAKPPGLVVEERLGVFVSALEQSEQLFRAAESVGPAARPLPLFYALSQAGRAIAAARLTERWRLSGHGLSALPSSESNILRRPIAAKAKAEVRRDSFAGVAAAAGSEAFKGTVELGRVWAAIPDLIEPMHQMPDLDAEWRRPLRAFLVDESHGDGSINPLRQPLQLLLDGLTRGASDAGALLDELKQYPSAGEPGGLTGVGGYHPPGRIRTADYARPERTPLPVVHLVTGRFLGGCRLPGARRDRTRLPRRIAHPPSSDHRTLALPADALVGADVRTFKRCAL
jgi:hypothetical protein